MASRLKRSAYAEEMAKRPSSFWRPATPAENVKLAGSPKAGRFVSASVPKGEARRNSVSITTTQFKTKQNLERYGEALTPSQAAKRRAEGTLGYTSRAAAEQAEKTRIAALRKRARRYLEENGEREARRARTISDVRNQKGERTGRFQLRHEPTSGSQSASRHRADLQPSSRYAAEPHRCRGAHSDTLLCTSYDLQPNWHRNSLTRWISSYLAEPHFSSQS